MYLNGYAQADAAMKEKSIPLRQRLLGNPERKILYSCGYGHGKRLSSGRRAGMSQWSPRVQVKEMVLASHGLIRYSSTKRPPLAFIHIFPLVPATEFRLHSLSKP